MFPRLVGCQALTCAEVAGHWWVRPHQKAVDFKAPGVTGLLLAQWWLELDSGMCGCGADGSKSSVDLLVGDAIS